METPLQVDSQRGFRHLLKSLFRKKSYLENSGDLAEEIHDLMDEGQARGFISNEESHMVYGVLDLKETRAQSVMVPRTNISAAPLDSTLGEIIRLVTGCGHTRIPIHSGNIDDIAGILHAKDLLKLYGESPDSKISPDLLRKPLFVPQTESIGDVLRDLKEGKTHLAVVTDEYGGTAGIITIEDIIEEIVGEILDEHDTEESLMSPVDDQTFRVDARLEFRKLEERLGVRFPEGEFESVGGFLIHQVGSLPKKGDKIHFDRFEFTVQEADQRKIDKVLVSVRPSSGSPAEEPPSQDKGP